MLAHLGQVWSDGDPFVLLDGAVAPSWSMPYEAYEREVVDGLAQGRRQIAVGDAHAILLGHEAGEGTLEVFRTDDDDLVAVIASYADRDDPETWARAAMEHDAKPVAQIEVTTDQVVFLRSAVSWTDMKDKESLAAALRSGTYAVTEIRVDCDEYGFDAWRFRRR